MKKIFGTLLCIVVFMFMSATTANAQLNLAPAAKGKSVEFNLTMVVNKYIEVTASPIKFDFGTTEHKSGAESLITSNVGEWNLVYANCPFVVSITGSNDANQKVPRFARKEVGSHANGYDILPTFFNIHFTSNNVFDQFGQKQWMPAGSFPITKNYTEAPHNGQVKMTMAAKVNTDAEGGIKVRKTTINPKMANGESADAGVYACKMVVTLTAL